MQHVVGHISEDLTAPIFRMKWSEDQGPQKQWHPTTTLHTVTTRKTSTLYCFNCRSYTAQIKCEDKHEYWVGKDVEVGLTYFNVSTHFFQRQWGKVKGKVVAVPLLTKHHALKVHWGSGGISPRILDLSTRQKQVVSFTPWPLYPQRKSPWYPLDRRLGGPHSWSGHGGEGINSYPLSGPEPPITQPTAQHYTTELSGLQS
jgi:hypothetical protein